MQRGIGPCQESYEELTPLWACLNLCIPKGAQGTETLRETPPSTMAGTPDWLRLCGNGMLLPPLSSSHPESPPAWSDLCPHSRNIHLGGRAVWPKDSPLGRRTGLQSPALASE